MARYARWSGRAHFHPRYVWRHLGNLYAGEPGARAWRKSVAEGVVGPSSP